LQARGNKTVCIFPIHKPHNEDYAYSNSNP